MLARTSEEMSVCVCARWGALSFGLRANVVAGLLQDDMWAKRSDRFPEHTPVNKEYYLLRSLFEEHFPEKCALDTIPKGLSVACSTPEAICWDPEWENMHDISGRAVAAHASSDSYDTAAEMVRDASPAQAELVARAARAPRCCARAPRFASFGRRGRSAARVRKGHAGPRVR